MYFRDFLLNIGYLIIMTGLFLWMFSVGFLIFNFVWYLIYGEFLYLTINTLLPTYININENFTGLIGLDNLLSKYIFNESLSRASFYLGCLIFSLGIIYSLIISRLIPEETFD